MQQQVRELHKKRQPGESIAQSRIPRSSHLVTPTVARSWVAGPLSVTEFRAWRSCNQFLRHRVLLLEVKVSMAFT
jgi:hypothetical protein